MIVLRSYQQELIEGCRQAYRDGFTSPVLVAPCGAGKSIITADIAKSATERGNKVLFLVHRKELCEQIIGTFTKYGVDMNLCNVMMVQTASRRLHKLEEPQLIITDEGHHCKASTYKKIYDYFPQVKKVFVTATPCRIGGGGLSGTCDILIQGPSVKWLIENNCLAPYRYFAPTLADFKGVKTTAGDFNVNDLGEILNHSRIYGDVLKYYKQLAYGKQAICYCVNVNHSKQMAEYFNENGVAAAHIDGDTEKTSRENIIQGFRDGEIKILCNVGLISEGFDVPVCEAVILLRPTKSLSLYIQQAMRCMRYQPEKTAIIIDHVGNYLRHGMPDDDREWKLDGSMKQHNEYTPDGNLTVRVCKECFATFSSSESTCPICHTEYMRERKEIEQAKEIQLREIKEAEKRVAQEVVKSKEKIEMCNSFQECVEWCKQHGKKTGYAWHYWNSRNYGVRIGDK